MYVLKSYVPVDATLPPPPSNVPAVPSNCPAPESNSVVVPKTKALSLIAVPFLLPKKDGSCVLVATKLIFLIFQLMQQNY